MAIRYGGQAPKAGKYGSTGIDAVKYGSGTYKFVDIINLPASGTGTSILCNYVSDGDGGYDSGHGYVRNGSIQVGGGGNPRIYTFTAKGKFVGTLTVSATVYGGQTFGIDGFNIRKNNSDVLVTYGWLGQQTKSYPISVDVNSGDYINVYDLFATSFWGDNASWANFSLSGTITP